MGQAGVPGRLRGRARCSARVRPRRHCLLAGEPNSQCAHYHMHPVLAVLLWSMVVTPLDTAAPGIEAAHSFLAVQFPIGDYAGEAAELAAMTREEVVAMLKRGSTGFSRGRSKYRGVTSEQAAVVWP
jgi:hypothetical protein